MVKWLLEEEMPIIAGPTVPAHTGGGFGVKHTMGTMAVLVQRLELFLRGVKVINNGRLFGKANLIVYAFATDGRWDPRSGLSLLSSNPLPFPKVKDGAELSIDPDQGVLVYDGTPTYFLNLQIVAVKDTANARAFAQALKDRLTPEKIGETAAMVAGSGMATGAALAGGGPIAALLAAGISADNAEKIRGVVTSLVGAAVDYVAKQGNPLIGVYYGSLTQSGPTGGEPWGVGLHPKAYPNAMIDCMGAIHVAYEVKKV